jgi:hypothetical protein
MGAKRRSALALRLRRFIQEGQHATRLPAGVLERCTGLNTMLSPKRVQEIKGKIHISIYIYIAKFFVARVTIK